MQFIRIVCLYTHSLSTAQLVFGNNKFTKNQLCGCHFKPPLTTITINRYILYKSTTNTIVIPIRSHSNVHHIHRACDGDDILIIVGTLAF